MKTKRNYSKPIIKKQTIDNDISLIMLSEGGPPSGPFDFGYNSDDLTDNKNTPYKV